MVETKKPREGEIMSEKQTENICPNKSNNTTTHLDSISGNQNPMKSVIVPQMPTNRQTFTVDEGKPKAGSKSKKGE